MAAISQAATVLVAGVALIYARGQVKEARETRERVAQPDYIAEQNDQMMGALGIYRDTPAIDAEDDGPDD